VNGLEYFLFTSIILLIAGLLLLIILLYKSRFKNIRDQKLITEYTSVIDKVLFPVIFNNSSVEEVIGSKDYQTYAKNKKFKKTLLEHVMRLHIVYSGDYNLELEEFYRKAGLIKISFAKLRSLAWNRKCEGIRELSQMNIQESFF
jgi:hypothetical protein